MSLKAFDWRLMLLGLLLNSGVVFLINLSEGTPAEAGGSGLLQITIACVIGGYLPLFVKRMAVLPNGLLAYFCGGPVAALGVTGLVGTFHAAFGSPEVFGTMVWSFGNVLAASSFLVWCKRDLDLVPVRLRRLAQWL